MCNTKCIFYVTSYTSDYVRCICYITVYSCLQFMFIFTKKATYLCKMIQKNKCSFEGFWCVFELPPQYVLAYLSSYSCKCVIPRLVDKILLLH